MDNQYSHKQLSKEIQATAQGDSYHGKALDVALTLPYFNYDQRKVIRRYIKGTETVSDRFVLQDIANVIIESE